jgi:FAD:protein FMN transferase
MSAWVGIDYAASTLTVPANSAIDLGGIGKGFAADILAEDLIDAGAVGALVNIGGDLVALGRPCDDDSWYLGIEDPRDPPAHIALLRLKCGAIATSGTTIRKWLRPDGSAAHHLIDPTSSQPSDSGIVTATVIAADAATAEVYATAISLMSGIDGIALLEAVQLAGIAVDNTGEVFTTSTLKDFLA